MSELGITDREVRSVIEGAVGVAGDHVRHAVDEPAAGAVPSRSWIVAYAMGLVASDRQVEGVSELVRHAGPELDVLLAARRHLDGDVVADPRLRQGAAELIDAAIEEVRRSALAVSSPVVIDLDH